MRLNHQRVMLSGFEVDRFIQPTFEFQPFSILPGVNASLPQFEVLELWIGIPDDSRCLFVGSDEQGRLFETLLYRDFEIAMARLVFSLTVPGDLPRAIWRASVFGCPSRPPV